MSGSPPKLGKDDPRRDPRRQATRDQERALIERDGFRCGFCGIPLVRGEIRKAIHREYLRVLLWGSRNAEQHAAFQCLWMQFDHVLPHSRGGRTDLDNLIVTCAPRIRPLPRTEWDGLERFAG